MKSGWTYSNDSGNREKLAPNTLAANVMMSENGPDLLDFIRDYTHPVGSIWMTSGDQDPNQLFGGNWIRIEDTFLLAAGNEYTAGETGGEATHLLVEAELPAVNRNMILRRFYNTSSGSYYNVHISSGSNTTNQTITHDASSPKFTGVMSEQTAEKVNIDFGNSEAHNNMPPYLVVNVWKRTA